MADKKISELSLLAPNSISSTDLLAIVNNNETHRITLAALEEYLNGSYVAIDINSSQILDLTTNPVVLLPLLNSGKYYDIGKIIFEYKHNTLAYSAASELLIKGLGLNGFDSYIWIAQSILSQGADVVTVINPNVNEGNSGAALGGNFVATDSVELTSLNNPTSGDGTLKVKIWYKIRTWG